ncbi:decarboxylase, partial [Vibrio lentus]|nr:decarboxylase [Vibrio lentus]
GDLPEREQPTLILEPGSAIVGDTVKFVSKIIDIKSVRGEFIAMSSGSKFNIGLLSSSVNMPIEVFSKEQGEYFSDIDISGFTCIESDYLYKGYNGPLSKDDYV